VFYLNQVELKWRAAENSVLIESQQFSVVVGRWMADLRLMQVTVADRAGIDQARFNQCLHGKLAFRPDEALRIAKMMAKQDAMMSRPMGKRVFRQRKRQTVSPLCHE
jgi:predicted XRE-type DNA-binding protein